MQLWLPPDTGSGTQKGLRWLAETGCCPYLPKIPRYALDELGRALVDKALLGEDVLLPLLFQVQVHSVRCRQEERDLSCGSEEAPGSLANLAVKGATSLSQASVSEIHPSFN